MFSRGIGGLERAFTDHASMLGQRGHVVHCLVPKQAPVLGALAALLRQHPQYRISIHEVNTQGWSRLLLPIRLRRLMRQLQPQVVVTHGAKAVSRMRAAAPAGVPVVGITHNASPRLQGATHLIALTQALRRHFVDRGFDPGRIWTVPNALPLSVTELPLRPLAPRQMLVIGVLARFVHKKGIDVFLRGFKLALARGLQARAIVAGDGPERAVLAQLRRSLELEDQVELAGWVRDPAQFYAGVDICCVPSRDEPFGLVVLEGFAHGVPVLAAAVGGPAELIADDVNGALFEPEDPESLARGLLRLADFDRRVRLRTAAYAEARKYHPSIVAQQLEAVLEGIIRTQPQAASG